MHTGTVLKFQRLFRILNNKLLPASLLGHLKLPLVATCHSASHSHDPLSKWQLCEEPLSSFMEDLNKQYKALTEHPPSSKTNHLVLNKLQTINILYSQYDSLTAECEELLDIISGEDIELSQLAKTDLQGLKKQQHEIQQQILELFIPPLPAGDNNVQVEVSAGVGGLEAMLFTAELFDMYQGYAQHRGWDFEVLQYEKSEIGGIRRGIATVRSHEGVFRCLSHESGVHRVQRIPVTERSGRVHTSTACVAVLPEPTEIDVEIHPKDLKIDTFKASGKGGQHVNKTDSAVRITHLPTGTVTESQQERSQHRNKDTALKILRSRLFEAQVSSQLAKQRLARSVQIGSRARSEKIRTYNFPQDRITDHRLKSNTYGVELFMRGTDSLLQLHEDLDSQMKYDLLENIFDEFKRTGAALLT